MINYKEYRVLPGKGDLVVTENVTTCYNGY